MAKIKGIEFLESDVNSDLILRSNNSSNPTIYIIGLCESIASLTINSENNVVARFRAAETSSVDGAILLGVLNGNAPFIKAIAPTSGGGTTLTIGTQYAAGINIVINNSPIWQITSSGHIVPQADNQFIIGDLSYRVQNVISGQFYTFRNDNTTNIETINQDSSTFGGIMIRQNAYRSANTAWAFLQGFSADLSDLEVHLRGDGNCFCDGSFSGGGADYAEYLSCRGVFRSGNLH